eukprot:TRINITY_DN75487_c0_g1_i1.p1 TRINITY_DN75487_c0_g1~~TRINITY_DN75487_c0_g1_i1.p1  ORF type:complete len:797 (+),score=152.98 TRINITY_DN75487_c0_g1_i1:18-2408(+)
MFSLFFGASGDGRGAPPVAEGHKAVKIVIDEEPLEVDVDLLSEVSGFFLQVQSTDSKECPLVDFPGGSSRFRDIVGLLIEKESLLVNDDTVLDLIEAAWLLECPKIFDEVMGSPFVHSLSSRRRAELLEHLLPFTAASSPAEAEHAATHAEEANKGHEDALGNWGDSGATVPSAPAKACEEFLRLFNLETSMWQRTERAALDLAADLDSGDFVLGPRLATGSLRVCAELLRLQRLREEESGFVSSALQPVSAIWKNLTDKPLRAKVTWDSHLFALRCIRRRLAAAAPASAGLRASAEVAGELREDEEARVDLPEELCESSVDRTLLSLAELVAYVDLDRLFPNWSALVIRTLLLLQPPGSDTSSGNHLAIARQAFRKAFARGILVQKLVWCQPAPVPAAWLADVAKHPEASKALLRVLGRFREMSAVEFCDLVEGVLLAEFLRWKHCVEVLLSSELVNDMVGACLDAGRKARAPRDGEKNDTGRRSNSKRAGELPSEHPRCPLHWAGQHVLFRLEAIGQRLFAAAFVAQEGFLPHAWPDCLAEDSKPRNTKAAKQQSMAAEDDPCCLEPKIVPVHGSCLWDEGLLTIALLSPSMAEGRSSPEKPILHYGRRVILRHLWHSHSGSYCEVARLRQLWDLACWSLCEDAQLIREALEYLKGTYRELLQPGGAWSAIHEEWLFQMFLALDLSVLPVQALQSPWVPAQVQAVRLLVQTQPAEQFNEELQTEVASAAESLKTMNFQCSKLTNKLNIVEQRTVMNKSQISEAMLAIEDHQRRKREVEKPSGRRASAGGETAVA